MSSVYEFGPFRLEVTERRLLRNGALVPLRPKVFDTLCALVGRHGHLVTKEQLFAAVWPDTVVEENNLALNITVLRKALQAGGGREQFVETVSGKGYRFVAAVRAVEPSSSEAAPPLEAPPRETQPPAPMLLERNAELDALRTAFNRARSGHRQLVCLSGEAGIGKTVLLTRFLAEASTHRERLLIGRGQCVEYVGAGEPYMPVLDAIGSLCRDHQEPKVVDWLARHAPTWLLQLPSLISDAEMARLRERTLGSTAERMTREAAEFLEALGRHAVVILALEDLQWSDPSTQSLLAALARRQTPARLLIVATHRTGESTGAGRSFDTLVRDLELHGLGHVVRPGSLSEGALVRILGERFPGLHVDAGMASLLRNRTSGNPLFTEALVDYWRASGAVRLDEGGWRASGTQEALRRGIPDTLKAMIERKLDVLSAGDHELLACASVIGPRFSSALLAAVTRRDAEEVEDRCVVMTSMALLRSEGVRGDPDRSPAGQYSFSHALYQEVLYERVPPMRRARLHVTIGRCLEEQSGAREERASTLAYHFSAGRDYPAAVRYLRAAAETALGRSAHREAAQYLRRGLELLSLLPDDGERQRVEFHLHAMLAPTALALEGFASPEAERSFARARELGPACATSDELLPLLYGLAMMHELRGEYTMTESVLHDRLASCQDDGTSLVDSEPLMACSMFHQGRFSKALEHAENGVRLYDPHRHLSRIAAYGENAGVACLGWGALALWFLGFPGRAVDNITRAVELSEAPGHLFSLSAGRTHGAHVHQLRRDVSRTREWADAARQVSEAQGYAYNAAFATVLQGWTRANDGFRDEGLMLMQSGLAQLRAISAHLDLPYLLALLAEVQMEAGLLQQAAATLDEAHAFVRHSRAFFYEAELYRLRACLMRLTRGPESEANELLRKALALARNQGARSLELRSATDLAEGLLEQGAARAARRVLQPVFRAFEEGFDTVDLAQAARVLSEAAGRP